MRQVGITIISPGEGCFCMTGQADSASRRKCQHNAVSTLVLAGSPPNRGSPDGIAYGKATGANRYQRKENCQHAPCPQGYFGVLRCCHSGIQFFTLSPFYFELLLWSRGVRIRRRAGSACAAKKFMDPRQNIHRNRKYYGRILLDADLG